MGFYPMSKRRSATDNWYSLDFDTRKKLMGGHARVGAISLAPGELDKAREIAAEIVAELKT